MCENADIGERNLCPTPTDEIGILGENLVYPAAGVYMNDTYYSTWRWYMALLDPVIVMGDDGTPFTQYRSSFSYTEYEYQSDDSYLRVAKFPITGKLTCMCIVFLMCCAVMSRDLRLQDPVNFLSSSYSSSSYLIAYLSFSHLSIYMPYGIGIGIRRHPTRIVSYRIISYRIVSYRILSYPIVSYRIVSKHIGLALYPTFTPYKCIGGTGQFASTSGWVTPEDYFFITNEETGNIEEYQDMMYTVCVPPPKYTHPPQPGPPKKSGKTSKTSF